MDLKQGRLIRAIGGFFDVYVCPGEVYRCQIKGKLKQKNKGETYISVGDMVEFSLDAHGQGIIEDILPRDNYLQRPEVANVSQLISVISARKPFPDWNLLSRQLVAAESNGIKSLICLNKKDLVANNELEEITEILKMYPYEVVISSALTGEGMEKVKETLEGHISVFSGSSGVGKSSLINAIKPDLDLETGEVSEKGKRGRHTTRRVEILPLNEGMIVDTPGFSKLDLSGEEMDCPDIYFPEMQPYRAYCKFRDCYHKDEPNCAVKKAVEDGFISEMRYQHYLSFLREMENSDKKRM